MMIKCNKGTFHFVAMVENRNDPGRAADLLLEDSSPRIPVMPGLVTEAGRIADAKTVPFIPGRVTAMKSGEVKVSPAAVPPKKSE